MRKCVIRKVENHWSRESHPSEEGCKVTRQKAQLQGRVKSQSEWCDHIYGTDSLSPINTKGDRVTSIFSSDFQKYVSRTEQVWLLLLGGDTEHLRNLSKLCVDCEVRVRESSLYHSSSSWMPGTALLEVWSRIERDIKGTWDGPLEWFSAHPATP